MWLALGAEMPRPKPPEPFRRFSLRLPQSLWQKLVDTSNRDGSSVNAQIRVFVEAGLGLPDSSIVSSPVPTEVLPWMEGR